MGIFANPQEKQEDNKYGFKVLFLHGLEGSAQGSKSQHLKREWAASSPSLRTAEMKALRVKCSGDWSSVDHDDIEEAMATPLQDAIDAVKYMKPDIIVGSSLGAAILYELYGKGIYSGAGVFLAPAIPSLTNSKNLKEYSQKVSHHTTVWILGEADYVVSNKDNLSIARLCQGNVMFSPGDSHRLEKGLESGLIDAAILTAFEISNH